MKEPFYEECTGVGPCCVFCQYAEDRGPVIVSKVIGPYHFHCLELVVEDDVIDCPVDRTQATRVWAQARRFHRREALGW